MPRSPMDRVPQRVLVYDLKRAIDLYTRERDRMYYRAGIAERRRLRAQEDRQQDGLRPPHRLDQGAGADPDRDDNRPSVPREEVRQRGAPPAHEQSGEHPKSMAPTRSHKVHQGSPQDSGPTVPRVPQDTGESIPGSEGGFAALAVTRVRHLVQENPRSARSAHVLRNLGSGRVATLSGILGEPLAAHRASRVARPSTTDADS